MKIVETRGRKCKYPWDQLKHPGDSFDVPFGDLPASKAASLRSAAQHQGITVAVRRLDTLSVYRVWRLQ